MKEATAAKNDSSMVVQLPYSRQQVADLLSMLYDYSIKASMAQLCIALLHLYLLCTTGIPLAAH